MLKLFLFPEFDLFLVPIDSSLHSCPLFHRKHLDSHTPRPPRSIFRHLISHRLSPNHFLLYSTKTNVIISLLFKEKNKSSYCAHLSLLFTFFYTYRRESTLVAQQIIFNLFTYSESYSLI